MPNSYDDYKVKCPFYLRGDKRKIVCEGEPYKYSMELNFSSHEERQKHREKYCETDSYHDCGYCNLLESRYERKQK